MPVMRWLGRRIISIHALRKESDYVSPFVDGTRIISIHALRKESDTLRLTPIIRTSNFNPRSP